MEREINEVFQLQLLRVVASGWMRKAQENEK